MTMRFFTAVVIGRVYFATIS